MTDFLKLAAALAALCALVVMGNGCGSSDSAEASLTKKQYLKRAAAICKQVDEAQYEKANEYLRENPKGSEEELVETAGVPPLEDELQRLEALPAPRGDEESVRALTSSFSHALEEAKEEPKLVLAQDKNPFGKFNRLSQQYGLDACTSTP